ncbi:MAG: hypothetical protein GXZ03_08515 [Proteiniphilum sp.]|nr:hypothetical protein [Proteiniphilum sp.]
MHITDEHGKWKVEGNIKMLIEPSESYLTEKELERQRQEEQELIESLKPSEKEVLMAEIELNTINLLIESGVI